MNLIVKVSRFTSRRGRIIEMNYSEIYSQKCRTLKFTPIIINTWLLTPEVVRSAIVSTLKLAPKVIRLCNTESCNLLPNK